MAMRITEEQGIRSSLAENLNLRVVCSKLGRVAFKWKKLGVQLGVPYPVLKEFEKEDDPLLFVTLVCGSPRSLPPYDPSSPCSSPPHGSPSSSIHCTDSALYPAYISPSNSIHDIPPQMPHPQTHGGPIIDGELPVDIIDQLRTIQIEPDKHQQPHQLNYYPDTSSPTEGGHHQVICNMPPGMFDLSSAGGSPIPPYPVPNPQKSVRKPKPPKPVVQVSDEHIKDIPTSAQLWEFTLRVLKKPPYHYMINWENRKEGLFVIHDAPAFAALWGKHRNRPNMTADKVVRAFRYYYKRDILNRAEGRLTYRFSKRLSKLYTTDESGLPVTKV